MFFFHVVSWALPFHNPPGLQVAVAPIKNRLFFRFFNFTSEIQVAAQDEDVIKHRRLSFRLTTHII